MTTYSTLDCNSSVITYMREGVCSQSAVATANTFTESRCVKQPASKCDEKATVLSKYSDNIAIILYDVIITGDLKFHVDNKSDPKVRRLCGILDLHGLTQHVNHITRKGGQTLDFVISRESRAILVGSPSIVGASLSSNKGKSFGDHLAVKFVINKS